MYRKCTVNLVPRRVLGPPDATVVGGGFKGGVSNKKTPESLDTPRFLKWLREPDLNRRPSGYEPDELPGCSIPRSKGWAKYHSLALVQAVFKLHRKLGLRIINIKPCFLICSL